MGQREEKGGRWQGKKKRKELQKLQDRSWHARHGFSSLNFCEKKEHFLWQQQLQKHPNCAFEWYCQVAQGCAGFMELKHNILSFLEAFGPAKCNTNLRVIKKEKKRGSNSSYESEKSQQISPEILTSSCFKSSITITETSISNFSVISAILLWPSAETAQHKL